MLTDFGRRDWYTAAMKGVILDILPHAVLVDITHDIPPGKVSAGSFVLAQCYREFPAETVFLAVVDPGVGTERVPIAVKAGSWTFVGPDNGLFVFLTHRFKEPRMEIRRIENTEFFKKKPSRTFHGRDIFAPAAAHRAAGRSFASIGPIQENLSGGNWPKRDFGADGKAEILYIDHFGNAIVDFSTENFPESMLVKKVAVSWKGRLLPFVETFAEVKPGNPLAYFGSTGHLEIAINGGNAAQSLGLKIGDIIDLRLPV